MIIFAIIGWFLIVCGALFALAVIFLFLSFIWDILIAIVSLFYPKASKLRFDAIKRMGPVTMC